MSQLRGLDHNLPCPPNFIPLYSIVFHCHQCQTRPFHVVVFLCRFHFGWLALIFVRKFSQDLTTLWYVSTISVSVFSYCQQVINVTNRPCGLCQVTYFVSRKVVFVSYGLISYAYRNVAMTIERISQILCMRKFVSFYIVLRSSPPSFDGYLTYIGEGKGGWGVHNIQLLFFLWRRHLSPFLIPAGCLHLGGSN